MRVRGRSVKRCLSTEARWREASSASDDRDERGQGKADKRKGREENVLSVPLVPVTTIEFCAVGVSSEHETTACAPSLGYVSTAEVDASTPVRASQRMLACKANRGSWFSALTFLESRGRIGRGGGSAPLCRKALSSRSWGVDKGKACSKEARTVSHRRRRRRQSFNDVPPRLLSERDVRDPGQRVLLPPAQG